MLTMCLCRYSILQRNIPNNFKARSSSLDLGLGQLSASVAPSANGDPDIFDWSAMDDITGDDWSTGFLGVLEGDAPSSIFGEEHTILPEQLDDLKNTSQHGFATGMLPTWTSHVAPLNMACTRSALQPLGYPSALCANTVLNQGSKLSSPFLDQYAALDCDESNSVHLREVSSSTEQKDPLTKDKLQTIRSNETNDDGHNEDSDSSGSTSGRTQVSTGKHRDKNKRRQGVTMELRHLEPDQVNEVLACILASESNVEVKISSSTI